MTPESTQAVDVANIPPLDETDYEELLPIIQQLLSDTQTCSSQQQSQGKQRGTMPPTKHIT